MGTLNAAMPADEQTLDGRALALFVADIVADTPASDTVVMDISAVSSFADFFVICSGENERQLRAIANAIRERLNAAGRLPRRAEGEAISGWIVLDYGEVVVHVFDAGQRSFYKLEALWETAPTILSMQ